MKIIDQTNIKIIIIIINTANNFRLNLELIQNLQLGKKSGLHIKNLESASILKLTKKT